ncbi:MAG: putative dehydrogenase [Caldanaerobacter subterraneus]|uniref:Predicted dehydrogenases and related proteins n=2 Tax=Caldanaerobacter subterraneus TaxID=911092 RepID=Q8R8P5_CALS4|nr:Gfo/Idh/MocA family oxidoreductase [Caldanaerobacter subterraneus]AAM25129.1 predicted dehydrogenases and related proteins [Caldanaerobacter subterraneus subsp. tengcongensis MB4]KUK09127.1 MAG: putative dehydrogenase [Caldanaerobacter subterraneus]MBE3578608.1 Gfo/Idh/MocA family oxidoreductase [Caldanaerobacter subterraneus]MCS3915279.1 putative dehydrogenase [Caldanaerobacter subterraneus subsp. tengcongensis MB4]TCO68143.1 putative dehydrogenase [Caldanaerobacter subterraneus]
MKKLRYACVGAGAVADYKHLLGYSRLKDVEIVAISDPDVGAAKRLAEKYSIPHVYENYEEMFEKEKLDLISICTPNYLHAPISIKAMEKGIHIHCEKPMTLNAKEAHKVIEAKNKYKTKFMVGLNNRFTNESYFVKKYIEEGYLGEIYHVKTGWRRRRGIPGKGGWFTTKKLSGGGPLIDLGVHFIDLVMYFMDYPEVKSVSAATYSKFSNSTSWNGWSEAKSGNGIYNVEDMAVGFIRLKNGTTIDFEFSWASNIEGDYNYYEILGDKGGIWFKNGQIKVFSEVVNTLVDIIPNTNYPKKPLDEFEHFVNCIKEGKEPLASAEEGAKLMEIIDAAYLSAEKGVEIVL